MRYLKRLDFIIGFIIFILLLGFVFRKLLLGIHDSLLGWYDYPYIIWILYENIAKIKLYSFGNFFDTNILFPYSHNTLLLADTFIPQSLIALPLTYFTNNRILVFNIVILVTVVLNYFSLLKFWGLWFKSNLAIWMAAIFFLFGPYFYLNFGNFQMVCYWPFFWSFYFFILLGRNVKRQWINLLLAVFFLSLQFLASVYLAVFLLFCMLLYSAISSWKKGFRLILNFIIVTTLFGIVCSPVIKGYMDTKKIFNFKRDYRDFIVYSANLSDYVFTTGAPTLENNVPIVAKWNSFDYNRGTRANFPGMVLFLCSLMGILYIKREKDLQYLGFSLSKRELFFLLLGISGFVFSLGPRLNFNGNYAQIPLPYLLILKLPFLESIRGLSRWSFLFYFAITFFAIFFIFEKLKLSKNMRMVICGVIFCLFLFENLPVNFNAYRDTYTDQSYQYLKKACENSDAVVLEIPYSHMVAVNGGLLGGLSYMTKFQLASLDYSCPLVNGYSGYDLPEKMDFYNRLHLEVLKNNWIGFSKILDELKRPVLLKVNLSHVDKLSLEQYQLFFTKKDAKNHVKEVYPGIWYFDPKL